MNKASIRFRFWLGISLLLLAPMLWAQNDMDTSVATVPPSEKICGQVDSLQRLACFDSLQAARLKRDSLLRAETKTTAKDATDDPVAQERTSNYAIGLAADLGRTGWVSDDLAKAVFVVAAVAAVGGTLFYLPYLAYKMIVNRENYPIEHEIGASYTYSSMNWEGGGSTLYRDTHMPGLRYTVLIAPPKVGLGLTLEGGYLAPSFDRSLNVRDNVDLGGAYVLVGPILRFAPRSPIGFSLEFLNGTSSAEAVGWVSKARANLQARLGEHALMGLNLGSLFYDLHFFDGTVWRQGAFNRDLSLTLGLEFGYRF